MRYLGGRKRRDLVRSRTFSLWREVRLERSGDGTYQDPALVAGFSMTASGRKQTLNIADLRPAERLLSGKKDLGSQASGSSQRLRPLTTLKMPFSVFGLECLLLTQSGQSGEAQRTTRQMRSGIRAAVD
jgi:hypothetical protein